MERDKRLPDDPLKPCMFKSVCPTEDEGPYCHKCQYNGLHYLASQIFEKKTRIPTEYKETSLYDLDMVGGALEVNRYLSVIMELVDEGKGFYAYGTQTGTGKTTMACLALRAYLYGSLSRAPYNLENRRVLYLNVPEFLDSLRRSYNREDLELESLIDELLDINRSPRLIVLDDLGAEKSSEWVMERLYSIINFRVSNKLAIIVTSNLSLDELEVKLGPRITSRLRGCCKQVKFEGKDHRRCNW